MAAVLARGPDNCAGPSTTGCVVHRAPRTALDVGCARHDRDMTGAQTARLGNEVFLRGRLAAEPVARTLPSGDELIAFRLTVPRPPDDKVRVRVDSIDCAALNARVRHCLERTVPGDELEVTGSLRRRFWRSPMGLGSRYEVLVSSVRRNRRRQSDA